jgi:hypothetical protein
MALRADTTKELRNNQAAQFLRVEDDTPLAVGDQVRIAIESSVGGYLYVLDRELYDDGAWGRALLIFPTLLTYGGDNRLEPGLPRMIPGSHGSLTVMPNSAGKKQVAESLTIIISPVRLELPRPLSEAEMVLLDDLYQFKVRMTYRLRRHAYQLSVISYHLFRRHPGLGRNN